MEELEYTIRAPHIGQAPLSGQSRSDGDTFRLRSAPLQQLVVVVCEVYYADRKNYCIKISSVYYIVLML